MSNPTLFLIPLASFLLTYLIGSFPSGVIVARLFGLRDLRTVGSGSTGATNVVRAGGKLPGALTLLLDILKAVAGLYLAMGLFLTIYLRLPSPLPWLATLNPPATPWWLTILPFFGPMIGHCFPVWLKFRGGKGIAVLIGSYLAYDIALIVTHHYLLGGRPIAFPALTGSYLALWLLFYLPTRISSVGGIGATLGTWLLMGALHVTLGWFEPVSIWFFTLLSVFVVARHHANIRRLARGEEAVFVSDRT